MSVEQTVTQLISTVGFPIFVTLWFMFRMEKVLNTLTDAVTALKVEIAKDRVQ